MSAKQWHYQGRCGWRAWWQWYKFFLLGWLLYSPISVITFWPNWRWTAGTLVGSLMAIWFVTKFARRLSGAGPYQSD